MFFDTLSEPSVQGFQWYSAPNYLMVFSLSLPPQLEQLKWMLHFIFSKSWVYLLGMVPSSEPLCTLCSPSSSHALPPIITSSQSSWVPAEPFSCSTCHCSEKWSHTLNTQRFCRCLCDAASAPPAWPVPSPTDHHTWSSLHHTDWTKSAPSTQQSLWPILHTSF